MDLQKVVLASNNAGKLREFNAIFAELDIELLPQTEFSVSDADETGKSFIENALIKARHAATIAKLPAIADDSGIEVDILDGEPGIYSARYAGEHRDDLDNLNLLLKNVEAMGEKNPVARFVCAMAYVNCAEDKQPVIAECTWEGQIVDTPQGENGFGYDPIFYVPTHQCTSAELAPTVKNQISHRGQAIKELLRKLSVRR